MSTKNVYASSSLHVVLWNRQLVLGFADCQGALEGHSLKNETPLDALFCPSLVDQTSW